VPADGGIPKEQQTKVSCMLLRSLPFGIIHYCKKWNVNSEREIKTYNSDKMVLLFLAFPVVVSKFFR
jgi:hypothetical protein